MQLMRIIVGLLLMVFLLSAATVPIQDMSPNSFSLEYRSLFGGQNIPDQFFPLKDVASYQNLQMLYLNYSPIGYLSVSVGVGVNKFFSESVSSVDFDSKWGLIPAGQVTLFSPCFANNLLRITGGVDAYYIHAQNEDKTVYREYLTRPFAGVVVSGSNNIDLSVGVRGHIMSGTIDNPSAGITSTFSNTNILRGYFSILLHSIDDGVYFSLDADASPKVSGKWKSGPLEASIAAAIGITITRPERAKPASIDSTLFPEYEHMKKKQDAMEQILE
jgi:hypothetical protein